MAWLISDNVPISIQAWGGTNNPFVIFNLWNIVEGQTIGAESFCCAGVNALYPGVSVGTAQHTAMPHPLKVNVRGELLSTGNF
jgi:hypothetical protein